MSKESEKTPLHPPPGTGFPVTHELPRYAFTLFRAALPSL